MANIVNELKQLLESNSSESVLDILTQVLPRFERLIQACHDLEPNHKINTQSTLCNSCRDKDTCSELCERVNNVLPKINTGRKNNEYLTGFYSNPIEEKQEDRLKVIFNQYEKCMHLFTNKQWIIICLYWRDGKTQKEISTERRKAPSTINEHLKKAKNILNRYYKGLREERLKYIQKIKIEDSEI